MLQPEHNNRDVKVINDLIDDLTRLETRDRERIPLGHMMSRAVLNNNNDRPGHDSRATANMLTKQSSLLSSGSRGSAPESVIIDTHSERVSLCFSNIFIRESDSRITKFLSISQSVCHQKLIRHPI